MRALLLLTAVSRCDLVWCSSHAGSAPKQLTAASSIPSLTTVTPSCEAVDAAECTAQADRTRQRRLPPPLLLHRSRRPLLLRAQGSQQLLQQREADVRHCQHQL
jgi:hypothetical protein